MDKLSEGRIRKLEGTYQLFLGGKDEEGGNYDNSGFLSRVEGVVTIELNLEQRCWRPLRTPSARPPPSPG